MNRQLLSKANIVFLALVLAGCLFSAGRGVLRGNMTDFYYFSGEEEEIAENLDKAVESFVHAAEFASRKDSQWLLGPVMLEKSAKAWMKAGMIQEVLLGDSEAAIRSFRAAIKADPDGAGEKAKNRLVSLENISKRVLDFKKSGQKHLAKGQYRMARKAFEQAVRLDPRESESRYLLRSAIALSHPTVSKSQASELLHLALLADGVHGVRIHYTPFWVHTAGKKRDALILDVPTSGWRLDELLMTCADRAALLMDYNLDFDFGRLVIRSHPGDQVRPPTFAAFRTDELHDVDIRLLKSYHRGLMTSGELLRQLRTDTPA